MNNITDDQILDFLIYLESVTNKLNSDCAPSDECGPFLNVDLSNDKIIVDYGWYSYEEGENSIYEIDLKNLSISKDLQGSSVMSEPSGYSDLSFLKFDSFDGIVNYMKNETKEE